MALTPCPECQHKVSDTARTCPSCGFQLKSDQISSPPLPVIQPTSINPQPQKKSNGCLWIIGIGVIFLIIASLFNNSNNTNSSTSQGKKEWYVGGTLHTKRLSDWRVASFENKLATSADWAANIKIKKGEDYSGDLTAMKADALMILSCVDEVAKDPSIDMQLNEIVASCAILMKMY